jgi:Ca2+-binding RTX toxin-like protein
VVTVGAGFDNALRVNIATGNDNISASASAAALTIAAAAASIGANDSLVGGTSTGDVLLLTADNDGTGAVFGATVSGFETITVVASSTATDDIKITTSDAMVAAGATLSVSAAALTNAGATFTFDGSAELNGKFSIVGGAGTTAGDTITGGLQADTIDGGAGADVIGGGAGADSITGGAGADTITGGVGADVINLTESASVADDLIYTASMFSEGGDIVTGFASGTDNLSFENDVMGDGVADSATLKTIAINGTVAEGDVFIEITTALSGDLTNASLIASNLSALTLTTVAANETLAFIVNDGTDSYVWLFTEDGVAGIQADDLTFAVKLVGVTDVADGDFLLG